MYKSNLSVNESSKILVNKLKKNLDKFQIELIKDSSGVEIIDAGINSIGSVSAGVLISEICMGGLGKVSININYYSKLPTWLTVRSEQPVIACLASQYAGWSLSASSDKSNDKKFSCLGSGPARALANREEIFSELNYKDKSDFGVLIMEVSSFPPKVIIEKIINDCDLNPTELTIILTPTNSLAGTTQVVGRVLEVALHKAHSLGFELNDIIEGIATAPLPAPGKDLMEAMGRTNDSILYGGTVHLYIKTTDEKCDQLARQLPSSNSRDYGKSFGSIFKNVNYDFYKIDPQLFAPAVVWISNLNTGKTWNYGRLNLDLLESLWIKNQ